MSRYQKGKTNLDFIEARDSEWQWHQLDHMQVCISLQTDNHASTPPFFYRLDALPAAQPTASYIHSHTHTFNSPLSGTTRVSRYQKGKTNLDFTGARDREWQWHQLVMCKSAPRSRQITTPAPQHSVFYRPAALPAAQPTASKH